MKLHVCTICVHIDDKPIEKLKDSCSHLGLDFASYGLGNKWLGYVNAKTKELAEYLESVDAEYILFSDGFDSWMLQDEKTILSKFKKFKSDIVISSSYTYHLASPKYESVDKPFKWICSGQWIGKKDKIIEALSTLYQKSNGQTSDNVMWDTAYKHKWFDFKIDHDCQLFLAMCTVPIDQIYFENGRIYNNITKTYPAGIHFNGPRGGHPNGINLERIHKLYLENR